MESQDDLKRILEKPKKTLERFINKVEFDCETGCWNWASAGARWGYGVFHYNGENVVASRFSWYVVHGEIPDGMVICHKCDNPSCVNPEHLFLGSVHQNIADMFKKKRHKNPKPLIGESNHKSKITDEDVKNIRKLAKDGMMQKDIANKFPINVHQIGRIIRRESWTHVKD